MPNQTEHGKAFEYACLKGIENIITNLGQGINCRINRNNSFVLAKNYFETLPSQNHRNILINAGNKMAEKLSVLEPRLIYPVSGLKDIIHLEIQPDTVGKEGDVRDILALKILLKSDKIGWEIGVSCKHNHKAVKHQRLSPHINIGTMWMNLPSNQTYFDDIIPVFKLIDSIKNAGTENWNEISDKETKIYKPLLKAVIKEIEYLCKLNRQDACKNFLSYLIGKKDFYKVVVDGKKSVSMQGFNFNGTLNQPADSHKPIFSVPILELPKQIYNIEFKKNSNTTINIAMDQGWSISMRIHNASTKIENSLKLDVQLISMPQNLYKESISLI